MRKEGMIEIKLTDNQASLILEALENEAMDDMVGFGEYSYARCYEDVAKKIKKAGFYSEKMQINGI